MNGFHLWLHLCSLVQLLLWTCTEILFFSLLLHKLFLARVVYSELNTVFLPVFFFPYQFFP